MLCHSLETLRESRILWHFIEPSFAFGASLSHFLPHCSLFFHSFWRVCARSQARGLAQGTAIMFCLKESVERITLLNLQFCWFYWFKSENTHYQKLWTSLERREKQALRSTKFLLNLFCFSLAPSRKSWEI